MLDPNLPQFQVVLNLLGLLYLPLHRRLDPLRLRETHHMVERGGALVWRGETG